MAELCIITPTHFVDNPIKKKVPKKKVSPTGATSKDTYSLCHAKRVFGNVSMSSNREHNIQNAHTLSHTRAQIRKVCVYLESQLKRSIRDKKKKQYNARAFKDP